jgi:ribonuclease PH
MEFYKEGDAGSKVERITVTGESATSSVDGSLLFKYGEIKNCWACYDLVEPVT